MRANTWSYLISTDGVCLRDVICGRDNAIAARALIELPFNRNNQSKKVTKQVADLSSWNTLHTVALIYLFLGSSSRQSGKSPGRQ